MELVLQRVLDLPLEFLRDIISVGDITNASEWFRSGKRVFGAGQPGVNLPRDESILRGSDSGQVLLDSPGGRGRVIGPEVAAVLTAGDFARAEEAKVNGEIGQLLGGYPLLQISQEPTDGL